MGQCVLYRDRFIAQTLGSPPPKSGDAGLKGKSLAGWNDFPLRGPLGSFPKP